MTPAEYTPERLGPYRLLDRIGEGGMGVVYLARDPEQRSVAVKILRPAVAGDPNARRRLAREVETMRRVRSPFVAEVLDTDVTSETPYIVTRYVPGRTLDEVVTQEGPLSGARLIRLAAGLADALAAIHAAGVVHRDLKPGNVMLMNGDPVVIDFGIAQALDSTRLTMTGMFMGTPGYLSPEVIEGQNSTSFSDVHAWGATVAFAATGRPPFGSGSYETIFYRIVNGKPDLTGVPAPMGELLEAALRRDPAQRPAAIQLRSRAAALDPAVLLPTAVPAGGLYGMGPGTPGPRAEGGPLRPTALDGFGGFGGPGGTLAAGPAQGATTYPKPGTQPIAAGPVGAGPVRAGPVRADDFADILPPVAYPPGQPGGRPGGYPGPDDSFGGRSGLAERAGGNGQADRPGEDRARADRARADREDPDRWTPPRRQPILVLATMVILVSLAIILPVAGTVIALALLVLLRAGDLAHRGSDQRGPIMSAAAFPFFVVRSLLSSVLIAPLALIVAAAVAGLTLLGMPTSPGLHALSYGAGGLVAFYAYGPGSGKARRQLNRVCAALVRSPGLQAVALFGMCALAVAAVATALTAAAAFWPLGTPTGTLMHLPAFPGLFGHLRPRRLPFWF
ncbi:MAG TPA: serine/threonine-protein kinase [Streptosporangiaceae bacterium]|nr:serine/threonine-protein kinase [Streptosporangiaceae bacterium]